ncbi:hypothetical protein Tco_1406238 [Tanacetum coccineum]
MRNPKMNKKKKMNGKTRGGGGGNSGSSANNNRMGGTSFTPTPGLQVKISKRLYIDYTTYLRFENNRPARKTYAEGELGLLRDVIAIKTDLEARPINQDTKFLLDSIENTIRIVKRFRKRIKDLSFDHTRLDSAVCTMVLLVVILPAGRMVSAGWSMVLLVIILPAGRLVSAESIQS